MLKLVKPSKKYLKSFMKVLDEYKKDKNHFGRGDIAPWIKAIEENKVDEYLEKLSNFETGTNLPAGYVSGTTFWLMDDNEWIGSFNIRHSLTPKLEQTGGHIAANISPKHRGEYSTFIGIKLCLKEAAKLGLKRVLMTCDVNNSASYKGILGLLKLYGGEQISDSIVEDKRSHRVWINTKKFESSKN